MEPQRFINWYFLVWKIRHILGDLKQVPTPFVNYVIDMCVPKRLNRLGKIWVETKIQAKNLKVFAASLPNIPKSDQNHKKELSNKLIK